MKKGISLVALVITIIVLIILSVTVMISAQTGIFDKAQEAVEQNDIAEMQSAAQLAWNDVYMEMTIAGESITDESMTVKVLEKLDASLLSRQNYNITVTTKGVSVTKMLDNIFATIFDSATMGNVFEFDGNFLETSISEAFAINKTYKITIQSNEFNGDVIMNSSIGQGEYSPFMFCVINNDNTTTNYDYVEAMADYQARLTEKMFCVYGTPIKGFTTLTNCTITKIQEQLTMQSRIFSGDIAVTQGIHQDILPSSVDIRPSKTYLLDLEINGFRRNILTQTRLVFAPANLVQIGEGWIVFNKNGFWCIGDNMPSITIKNIYEAGEAFNCIEENGFTIYWNENQGKWCLVDMPSTPTIIPESIEGHNIEAIWMDCISGTPIFNRFFQLETTGEPIQCTSVICIGRTMVEEVQAFAESQGVEINITEVESEADL